MYVYIYRDEGQYCAEKETVLFSVILVLNRREKA